ncbi:hypothetical protein D9758_014999 [Tetrapyrgos nigripes]|uniref:Uncharacterized protein n=1 Tax=Tetrapyrgos nigripes TaxID=182062 RepID=A0A8H5CEU1_9AGAR|nr:hypothetical protein D9758_014999 [Tetrapyrgos nigripes]
MRSVSFTYSASVQSHNDIERQESIINEFRNVPNVIFIIASVLTGDCVITYRLWIIWGHKFQAIIIPIMTICGILASGIASALANPTEHQLLQSLGFTKALLTFWRKPVDVIQGDSTAIKILIIFVESAALYLIWAILVIIIYPIAQLRPLYIPLWDIAPEISGIACTMINVRVGLGLGSDLGMELEGGRR